MNNYFANNFSEILRLKGISQKQFAEFLDVRPSTVNQWVKGKREPSFRDLVKICTLLEVDFNELMGQYICTRNRQAIIRDIIGGSTVFQKEQRELMDTLAKQGLSYDEIIEKCEELYLQYYQRYKRIFQFSE